MARFIVFGDSHGADLDSIIRETNSQKPDAVLITGDLRGYTPSGEKFFLDVLQLARDLSRPAYVIPGSHEHRSEWGKAFGALGERKDWVIDLSNGKTVEVAGIVLVPYGGATWTPIPEAQRHEAFLINPLMQVSDLAVGLHRAKGKPTVLMMHESPRMYGDIARFFVRPSDGARLPAGVTHEQFGQWPLKEEHAGNEQVQDLIEGNLGNRMPNLTLFGHIHENHELGPRAQEVPTRKAVEDGAIVKHLTLNPGPLMRGYYGIVSIGDAGVSHIMRKV